MVPRVAALALIAAAGAAALSKNDIVPAPARVTDGPSGDVFRAPSAFCITMAPAHADSLATAVDAIQGAMQQHWSLGVAAEQGAECSGGTVELVLADAASLSEEYAVDISSAGIRITAMGPAGVFYGAQSLVQLMEQHAATRTLPSGRIEDKPAMEWRGMMLDVARHFFGVDVVLRVIDNIARYKINRLHLHLSDDQGWRLEIKSMPRLAGVGSRTAVGGGPGGFYTQEEYRRIAQYAAQRFVTLVPEFDMPAHTHALIAAYPVLRGPGSRVPDESVVPVEDAKLPLYSGIAVGFSCLDVNKELTYTAVENIVREVAAITPGAYIHIGGDEAEACPHGAPFAQFIQRASDIVRAAGKQPIGWQEAGGKGVALQQFWWPGRPMGAAMKTIMSPANRAYLDMKYSEAAPTPGLKWAGYISAKDAYTWDPVEIARQAGQGLVVVGVEAPLWSETIVREADIYTMIFPRLPAIAEVAWTPAAERSWDSFARRIASHSSAWTRSGLAFYRAPEVWGGVASSQMRTRWSPARRSPVVPAQ